MRPLRIGIDGYNLAMPRGTGVATYGFTLAQTLARGGHTVEGVYGIDPGTDPQLREIVFFEKLGRDPIEPTPKRRQYDARRVRRRALLPFLPRHAVDVPLTGRVEKTALADRFPAFDRLVTAPWLFEIAHRYFAVYGRFLRLKMANPPDIMHWTYPVPVHLVGARNIYTLHDIVPLRLPYTTLDAKRHYRSLIQACIARADHLCTVSEASRADIIAEFDLDPNRISNSYQASPLLGPALDAAQDAAIIKGVFGLDHRSYFLFFGAIEPKKNIGRLLEAYLSLQTDTSLVMVGGRAWQSENELALLTRAHEEPESEQGKRLGERVIRLDHLPRDLLFRLIRGARAVTFPSIYEGFGLPLLEAMRLGTPVLTSNISSLPEIAGGAALLVDPYDSRSIAQGLASLDRDADLRARLSRLGPVRAAHFSQECFLKRLEFMYARTLDV